MKAIYAKMELWMYRLLFVSFFLPAKIQTWLVILYCVWISINAYQQKIFLNKSELLTALLLGGGYLFYVAYLPLTPPKNLAVLYALLERKFSLFILPFMVPLMYKLSSKPIFKELRWFVAANIVHGMMMNAILMYTSTFHSEYGSGHVAYRLQFENICSIHPTYYGMYICFSVAILLFDPYCLGTKKWYLLFAHLILLLLILLLTPKISLLILFLIYCYYFLFTLTIHRMQKLLLLLASLCILLISFIALPFFHDRIAEVFGFLSKSDTNALENSLVFRKLIYQIDLNILKGSWLFGIGPGKLQEHLDMAYFNLSVMTKQMIVTYNTHNEYLNQWICFGLGGFLYFISTFVIHIKKALVRTNVLYLSFMLIVMISCLTENILSRQSGILFVALFSALFYFSNNLFKKTIE